MREFNIRDFGAVGDGVTMNTEAIQKAIDACAEQGGGRVTIGEGVYMSGSLTLRSGIDFHIEQDGVLLGSPRCEDYPEKKNLKHVDTACLPRFRNASFLFAEECENISLTGMGKIDCNGTSFVRKKQGDWTGWEYERIQKDGADLPTPPRVVFFTGCSNIRIEDITMTNQPAGWSYWIHDCDYVSFDRCRILADVRYPNNDGIHINSSRNVTVSNCDITTGDDCIIVRANNRSLKENRVCEKVTVTNCNLTSYSGGIRIAWLSDGVIRNCTFSNIVMTDTTTGISIALPGHNPAMADQGRENTLIENLKFQNIVMDRIYARPVMFLIEDHNRTCEGIRNISFTDIYASGLEFPMLKGRKDCCLKDITFTNCKFVKESDETLPNYQQHGASAWGRRAGRQMVEYAENVVFQNTSFTVV